MKGFAARTAGHSFFAALLLLAGMVSAEPIYNSTFNGTDYGIYSNQTDVLVANNTIFDCGHGIYNYQTNSTIENNSIYSNTYSGIVNRDNSSTNITAGNSIYNNGLYGIVNINSTPAIGQSIGNSTLGKVLWSWYVRIKALNSTGGAVSGANITLTDNQSGAGAYQYWEYWNAVSPYPMATDGSGWTDWFLAYQNRTNNASTVTALTQHTIYGIKSDVGQGWNVIIMDESKEGNVTLNQTLGPQCNVSIWVDGVKTSTIAAAGRPYNLTVGVTNSTDNSSLSGVRVYLEEDTGILPFALLQIIASNVSNTGRGALTTNANGNATLTIVPTGGDANVDAKLGSYSLRARVDLEGQEGCSQNVTLTSRSFATPSTHVSIPNRNNIIYFKDDVYRVFNVVKVWLDLGGGENHNITIYSNGTATGMGFSVWSGKPIGMNITVLNASDDSPIPNAVINITEFNGILPWTLIQSIDSNVSPSGTGSVRTDANGNARFTFIATGGTQDSSIESKIGPYNITLEVFSGTARIYNSTIANSHRAIDYTPSGSVGTVPSQSNLAYYKDDVYRLFNSILLWLNE